MAITSTDVRNALLARLNDRTTIYAPNSGYIIIIIECFKDKDYEVTLALQTNGVAHIIKKEEAMHYSYVVLANQTAALYLRNQLDGQEMINIKGKQIPYYAVVFEEVFGELKILLGYEKSVGVVGFRQLKIEDLI